MSYDPEIHEFLLYHLGTVMQNDIAAYVNTCTEDLTIYEWWVTPQRIDGIPFHEFMMSANDRQGTVFGADGSGTVRFDLANLNIQRYGDTAVASYTLLISTATSAGVKVVSHNESRVIVRVEDEWKVIHVHKSPAWNAPHQPKND